MKSLSDHHPSPLASPCIRICRLDEQQICIGCLRSSEEIGRWGAASDAEKLDILARIRQRSASN
jgi:predicted Fe-S protein YdhL (DUF1289 family)